MTQQVIEQAVAEDSIPAKTAAEEVSVTSISQAVNGSQPTSNGNNTPAETSEGTVAESPATVNSQQETTVSDENEQEDKPKRKRRRKKRNKRRKLETYAVGDEVEGVVRSVQSYGAFIDVGAERDGLIHISELREGYVEKVEDVIKEHDKVTVRIKDVNVETGRLSLTMLSPESIEAQKEPKKKRVHLRYLEEGQELVGRVNSIVDFGAFIDIGATTDGLVHISQISEDHISSVSDVLQEGQEVNVRILSIDKKRKRISLTMREPQVEEEESEEPEERESVQEQYNDFESEEENDEETLPSLMAIAFARANARKKRKNKSKKESNRKQSSHLDEIISRMLDQHRTEE